VNRAELEAAYDNLSAADARIERLEAEVERWKTFYGVMARDNRRFAAENGRLRDAFDRFLTACANREHEGMPRDEWEAEFLTAEQALAGEETENPPRDG